nr:glutamate 5-kinase [Actinoplanes digitatis]
MREQVTGARRVVVKVGSSSLTTAAGGIDEQRMDALVDVLGALATQGREVVLVSSGAIAASLAPLKLRRRPRDLATQQAAASVGQGLLMGRYTAGFARHGLTVGQVLLTVDDVTRRAHYRNAYRTLRKLLDLGALPIVNENDTVATDEIRFGDNDRLAALVAALVHADLLVLLSDVDALYTGSPSSPGARRVSVVHSDADLADISVGTPGASGVGTGGMVTKVEAARIATGFGIPVVLTAAGLAGPALDGAEIGTLFHAAERRPTARLFWLAHATSPRGRLHLDPGAVAAVVARRKSLLPSRDHGGGRLVRGRGSGRPGRRRLGRAGGARPGELRRGGAAGAAGALDAGARGGARPGLRARGGPPRRPGPAVTVRDFAGLPVQD